MPTYATKPAVPIEALRYELRHELDINATRFPADQKEVQRDYDAVTRVALRIIRGL